MKRFNEIRQILSLAPIKAAKVSEISEATASSSIAADDKVNFHIGNPVQDDRLSTAYLRMVLGLGIRPWRGRKETLDEIVGELGATDKEKKQAEFFFRLIGKCAPYTPRGGFLKTDPVELVRLFKEGLVRGRQEPLDYDLGEKSGRREIILAGGGVEEALRIFLFTLHEYALPKPARVFLFRHACPGGAGAFPELSILTMTGEEEKLPDSIFGIFREDPDRPLYLVIGGPLAEKTRRRLRHENLDRPLFFVETGDVPNHQSLAREAGLTNRVVRILTPGILSPKLRRSPIVFFAGNADYLKAVETVHFQLKGTPPAGEIEMASAILAGIGETGEIRPEETLPLRETGDPDIRTGRMDAVTAGRLRERTEALEAMIEKRADAAGAVLERIAGRERDLFSRLPRTLLQAPYDGYASKSYGEILDEFMSGFGSETLEDEILRSFLQAFIRHHPEYRMEQCFVVSGSGRTAFGLLGRHCGIDDVVVPDLSWTYEHGFRHVSVVPLTSTLDLDVDGMLSMVDGKLAADPSWREHGAVVVNNPHNATGRTAPETGTKRLLVGLLHRGIRVMDDLSYQNVAPRDSWPSIPTLRQIGDNLLREGTITESQSDLIVTVQALSKTDCLAGARLAVVEIRDNRLYGLFKSVNDAIRPNGAAVLLAYLFYRNTNETVVSYWKLRNAIFKERMDAILEALLDLPKERNQYGIVITPPQSSMYPHLTIEGFPSGLSLDWLASGLSRQGIGLIPLTTFARTEQGYEIGRKSFRLTLGGPDGADVLRKKTRRVLIDLNRMIAEESSNYNRRRFSEQTVSPPPGQRAGRAGEVWKTVEDGIVDECRKRKTSGIRLSQSLIPEDEKDEFFFGEYLPERLNLFRRRFLDRDSLAEAELEAARRDKGKALLERLEKEYFKDSLERREKAFLKRTHDRTVHPTQMYSLRTEILFETVIEKLIRKETVSRSLLARCAEELRKERWGMNVAIDSTAESEELKLELTSMIAIERYTEMNSGREVPAFLSFWGDWDGSNRPSGQGHRLVAAVLMENVFRLARTLRILRSAEASIRIDPDLLKDLEDLPEIQTSFFGLMNDITLLTNQLEKRYKGILPFDIQPGAFRRMGMALRIARDPLTTLWEHNDRLEKRMLALRERRREMMERHFSLNKRLRKALNSLLPEMAARFRNEELLRDAVLYRDLMKRFVITPRIHQNLITAQDPFAIETTVYNVHEINEMGSIYGNPGMVLSLQVSMSTEPEALLSLQRKSTAEREKVLRTNGGRNLPSVRLVPLFEDVEAVRNIPAYLSRVWEYALQSRRLNQDVRERFLEMISEIFIAGSDLSQHVGQAAGMAMYRKAKHETTCWLAERGLAGKVRLKLGSGEPMQRQGGYYAPMAGRPAFRRTEESRRILSTCLSSSTIKSTDYAVTPLMGVFAGGDLRTLQSNVAETLRYLPVSEAAQVYHHMREAQRFAGREVDRACEPLIETRLRYRTRGLQELERLTMGVRDEIFEDFLSVHTDNFRQIVYGREEDVVGLHLISYFIARTTPPLRDRPTVRPGKGVTDGAGRRILEKIAGTIPFAKYGSLLRAIGHNQAQSAVLGVNQLTTGLFRALDQFEKMQGSTGEAEEIVKDRILPHLPVYEILHTLRLYHDVENRYWDKLEKAFPPGNSAFLALREDVDLGRVYLPRLQAELLRRHGLNGGEFFSGDGFRPELLPTLRPDLSVLLQPDLFNTDIDRLVAEIGQRPDAEWLTEVEKRLAVPARIRIWRERIWRLMEDRVFVRVRSFAELAVAIQSLSARIPSEGKLFSAKRKRASSSLAHFLKKGREDRLQEFLGAAMEYLNALSEETLEVPIDIIRAMKDVERIVEIEEQALSREEQDLLRYFLLEIARLAGENG